MSKLSLAASVLFVSIVSLGGGPRNVAQEQEQVGSADQILPFSSLKFEIVAPSEALISLQPIPVILKLTNNNSRRAFGYKTIGIERSPVFMSVRKTGTDLKVPITMLDPLLKLIKYTNVPLEPQESVESKDLLTLGLARYFPEPGSYEIQASLASSDYSDVIESNIVTITIGEPTGTNRAAYNFIKNSSFQEYLFSGAEFNEVRKTLESVKTLYPTSSYARNASFVLGENYFYGRNYPQALINLARLENDNDFAHAAKVKKYLSEIRAIIPNQTGTEKREPGRP